MNSLDAHKILGVSTNASEQEIKTAFRKKAAKLHPDVNKAENAEEEFKKLNEAYQCLIKKDDQTSFPFGQPFPSTGVYETAFGDLFQIFEKFKNHVSYDFAYDFRYGPYSNTTDPSLNIIVPFEISFEEAVLGCIKEIDYKRKVSCPQCIGEKYIRVKSDEDTDCEKCKGTKYRDINDKSVICTACRGTGKTLIRKPCHDCDGTGMASVEAKIKVKFKPGSRSGDETVFSQRGHYKEQKFKAAFSRAGADKITVGDLFIRLSVKPDSDLRLIGNDVTSLIELTLLEALTGTSKEVRTVRGKKTLAIPGPRKHGDQIEAQNFGVPPFGKHIFVIDVKYPDNIDSLVTFLKGESRDGYIDDQDAKNLET